MTDHWVLGVDPGKMTGLARFDAGAWVGSWQLPMDDFLAYAEGYMYEMNQRGISAVIACEDFRITMQTAKKSQGDRQWSLEQIGVLRRDARKYGHEFELSPSGNAKTFGNDNKLKAAGWWNPGHGHANDAARQVVIALGRRNIVIGMD